jgi:aldehyde dehydrogenase family protein
MSRFPSHTVESAPGGCRPLLQKIAQSSPTGRQSEERPHDCPGRDFGPVLNVIAYDTEEDAIRIANGSRYGLHACVIGKDVQRARRVASQIRAGRVGINGMTGLAGPERSAAEIWVWGRSPACSSETDLSGFWSRHAISSK